ncbi:MAG: hypothetical protein RBR87_11740 [Bacteroidales bacterium]|jgi:hypothetical protein|nr:hypothetical protein [Bacteroidales bacterium]
MISLNLTINRKKTFIASILNVSALAFIYFTPALSHLLNLPIYLIEPMRLMLILALVHTNKRNAYLLAFTLPLFSFLVSGHPVFAKMLLISFELAMNVFLFYFISKRTPNILFAAFGSILLSKAAYYLVKFGLLQVLLLNGKLISTPLFIQLITALIFSLYCYLLIRKRDVKT